MASNVVLLKYAEKIQSESRTKLLTVYIRDQHQYSPNRSLKRTLSFSPKICKMECNTTSHWLNHMVSQSEVVLHSNAFEYRKIWRTERLLNTDPDCIIIFCQLNFYLHCPSKFLMTYIARKGVPFAAVLKPCSGERELMDL